LSRRGDFLRRIEITLPSRAPLLDKGGAGGGFEEGKGLEGWIRGKNILNGS
jgi:hypothetical protein